MQGKTDTLPNQDDNDSHSDDEVNAYQDQDIATENVKILSSNLQRKGWSTLLLLFLTMLVLSMQQRSTSQWSIWKRLMFKSSQWISTQ